jgi:hypothetical protein
MGNVHASSEEAIDAGVDWVLMHMNRLRIYISFHNLHCINFFVGWLIFCVVVSCARAVTLRLPSAQ